MLTLRLDLLSDSATPGVCDDISDRFHWPMILSGLILEGELHNIGNLNEILY